MKNERKAASSIRFLRRIIHVITLLLSTVDVSNYTPSRKHIEYFRNIK